MRDKEKYNDYHKEYQRTYQLNKYRAWRIEALIKLGGKCVVCGSTEKLDIDHINAYEKKYQISSLFSRKKEDQDKELAKCQLLCDKHHISKTKSNREAPQTFSTNEDIHGSGYMYTQQKCKCFLCRAWNKAYKKKLISYKDIITDEQAAQVKESLDVYNTIGITHGTRAGYLKEGRLGIERCIACKKANAEYTQNRMNK